MAENFGLVRMSMRTKLGRKSFFTPEGKVALMFLKMYTGLSCTKLLLEGIEKSYAMMCELNSRLGILRPWTKFLGLLCKILKEIREIERETMRMQKLKGLVTALLRLKTLNYNPYLNLMRSRRINCTSIR